MTSWLEPNDFDNYLPWACRQLQVEIDLLIISDVEAAYVSKRTPVSAKKRHVPETKAPHQKTTSEEITAEKNENDNGLENLYENNNFAVINTIYDSTGNLTRLKLLKNKFVPSTLLKVIGIILKFHEFLNNVTIDKGLNNESLYEVSKLLDISNITELCLDNTNIPHGCYYYLLEKETHLKNLSLCRCNISSEIVEIMASKLKYPLPASKTLTILNLTSNKIRDAGAKFLAASLKVNRQLAYLNISDNAITDEGAAAVLDTLKEFPMTPEELIIFRTRYLNDCKDKLESLVIEEEDKSLRSSKKKPRAKSVGAAPTKKKNMEKDTQTTKEDVEVKDPFFPKNRFTRSDQVYSYGNNYLAYLNLSFNNLSYLSVKKLLDVMLYQQMCARIPKGLVSVCIEGNYIPDDCSELTQTDQILQDILAENSGIKCGDGKKKGPVDRASTVLRK